MTKSVKIGFEDIWKPIFVLRVVSPEDLSERSPSQKRRRGVILSSQGWQRLQAAQYLSAARDKAGSPYTLEQLSDCPRGTSKADRTGLSTKTLTKVRRRQNPVDQPTLAAYFPCFKLYPKP